MKHMVKGFVCLAFAAGMSFSALAESYIWKGGTSVNFEDAANWEPEGTPGAADSCIIPRPESGATAVTVNTALNIAALTVGGGEGAGTVTLTFANGVTTNKVSGNVDVLAGGKLTHKQQSTTANSEADALYKLILHVGGNMTINGGSVNVDLCGYYKGKGPGRKDTSGGSYGGTAHGGALSYGSIRNPIDLGSGGEAKTNNSRWGGGAVILDVAGTLTVDGSTAILARGESDPKGSSGCGAAGGTINLRVGKLAGSGSIIADQSQYATPNWDGSGGRIAVVQRTETTWDAFTGTIRAAGGQLGSPGTIFKKLPGDTYGELIIPSSSATYATDISTRVTDWQEPFDRVTVTSGAKLSLADGITLKVTQGIDVTGGTIVCSGSGRVELVGDDDFIWRGGKNFTAAWSLLCEVPGKKLYFANDASKDVLTIPADASVAIHGDETEPVYLLPLDGTKSWSISKALTGSAAFEYVAVSNSVAVSGSDGIEAKNSQDLGGNEKWSFVKDIVPGEEIVWTGASAADPTDWLDSGNWDRGRQAKDTDYVHIPSGASSYPSIPAGDYVLNRLQVDSGASLTLSGANLTVTNELAVQGALVFSGTETLHLPCPTVNFNGGTVTPANSAVAFDGEADQVVDLGGCSFNYVNIVRAGNVAFGDGFSAKRMIVRPTAALTLTFAAEKTVTVDALYLQGEVAGEKALTLRSSSGGTRWNINLTQEAQQVYDVMVSDSNATGVTIRGGSTTTGSNTTNWDFNTNTASWTGGAGTTDFATAGNWVPAVVPDETAVVVLPSIAGETVSVVVPANSPASVRRLMLGSGAGTVQFTAQSPITVAEPLEIPANATVALDCFDTPSVVSNDVVIRSGGVLTHDRLKKLNLVVMGDLTIEDGGSVDVNEKGYYRTDSSQIYVPSLFEPTDFGECGDGSKYSGGVAKLEVTGTLTVIGAIDACGTGGGGGGTSGGGGSIWLTVGTLAGSGRLRAHPCKNPNYPAYDGNWCKPGGHIAVYQRVATNWDAFTGTMNADGGKRTVDNGGESPAGTIYLETAADQPRCGEVIIRSDHTIYGETLLPLAGDGDIATKTVYTGVKLTVDGANLGITNSAWAASVPHTMNIRDIDVQTSRAKVNLHGATLKVSQLTHRGGRDWEGWSKSDKTAAYQKHVVEGGGKIIWPTPGLVLMFK